MSEQMKASPEQLRAICDVMVERDAQDAKWGVQNHEPFQWLSILGEEVGEVCQAANKAYWNSQPWRHYREELVQVAAVAVAAIECLDRWEGEAITVYDKEAQR